MSDLPIETGFYLWFILDLGYLNVGCVQVMQDSDTHLEYLRGLPAEKRGGFYVYPAPVGRTLTMYHQAHDHLPPSDVDGRPLVDGFVPFDMRTLEAVA